MPSVKTKWFAGAVILLMVLFPPCVHKGVWIDWKGTGEVAASTNAELDQLYFGGMPHYAWIGSQPFTTIRKDHVTLPVGGVNWTLMADTSAVSMSLLAAQVGVFVLAVLGVSFLKRGTDGAQEDAQAETSPVEDHSPDSRLEL